MNVTVIGHPELLATMARLAETFEPREGFGHWLLQVLPHWPLVRFLLFFSFPRKFVSDEPSDSHHLQSVPRLPDGELPRPPPPPCWAVMELAPDSRQSGP